MGSILLTLRHEFISCSALHLMGPVPLTLRHEFISCSALTSVGSISLTLRHQFTFAVDHSPTSRLWACWVLLLMIHWKNFCWSQKVCHSPDEIQLQKNVEERFKHLLEERALLELAFQSMYLRKGPSWSSPFKLAKMITIWPQNRCISPGLAGNRDFVFPFEWPVSFHRVPPMSALARGAKLLLWAASQ